MNNPESTKIINRFYEVIELLKQTKQIRGIKTFKDRYDINRWNFITVSKNPESDMFQLIWISHLIKDFNVSAEWIMTGKGEMFVKYIHNNHSIATNFATKNPIKQRSILLYGIFKYRQHPTLVCGYIRSTESLKIIR